MLLNDLEDQDLGIDEEDQIMRIEDVESPSDDQRDHNRQILSSAKMASSHIGAGQTKFDQLEFNHSKPSIPEQAN